MEIFVFVGEMMGHCGGVREVMRQKHVVKRACLCLYLCFRGVVKKSNVDVFVGNLRAGTGLYRELERIEGG